MEQLFIDLIDIKTYLSLEDTTSYDIFINSINESNSFNGNICSVNNLTYDEVEIIKNTFKNPTINGIKDLFIMLYKLGDFNKSAEKEFYSTNVFDFFGCKNFWVNWITKVIERENSMFSEIDDKMLMINAGERLKHVSHLLSKMRLAEQFGCTPTEIGNMKYNIVFSMLVANKINNDIQKDYIKQK